MSYLTEEEQLEKKKEEKRRLCRQQIIEYAKKPLLYTPFGCCWLNNTPCVVVFGQHPNHTGAVCVYKVQRGELCGTSETRPSLPIKCATMRQSAAGESHLATGDFAGSVAVYDLSRDAPFPPIFQLPKAHQSIINSIDGGGWGGPPELLTGSRDGAVRVWDVREPRRAIAELTPAKADAARDCWCVRFGNSHTSADRWVAAGYDNGDVKLFDLRARRMLHEFNCGNGVCDMDFDRPDIEANKLLLGLLEGRGRVYDLRTHHPTMGFAFVEDRVSSGTVWAVRALPQNREIYLFGGAGEVVLGQYLYPPERSLRDTEGQSKGIAGTMEELNRIKIGDQPINAIDWSRGKEGLVAVTSFDQCIRVLIVTKLSALS